MGRLDAHTQHGVHSGVTYNFSGQMFQVQALPGLNYHYCVLAQEHILWKSCNGKRPQCALENSLCLDHEHFWSGTHMAALYVECILMRDTIKALLTTVI